MSSPYAATVGKDGVRPGPWMVPGVGASRFDTLIEALWCAYTITGQYGPGVYQAIIKKEPSKSRPGVMVFQVYISSCGGVEGLVKYDRAGPQPGPWPEEAENAGFEDLKKEQKR